MDRSTSQPWGAWRKEPIDREVTNMSKTVVLLIEATGLKGRKVIRHLATDSRFSEKFDLRVVLDDTGEATDTLDRWNVPWDVTNNRSNPKTALERVSPESGIDYLVACGWGISFPMTCCQFRNRPRLTATVHTSLITKDCQYIAHSGPTPNDMVERRFTS